MRSTLMKPRASDVAGKAPQPKLWVREIDAYMPGAARGKDGQALVKLSANENPLGTSPRALKALAQAREPARYPDPDAHELRAAIGALHAIDPARIVCGTGSDELLNLAALAYAGGGAQQSASRPDEVLFARYSFSVYPIAARRCGARPVEAADKDYGCDVDALLDAVTQHTRVVFLANPNNPTGTYLPRDALAQLHAGLPGEVLLVVDQAYAEYLDEGEDDGALALAQSSDNVLVTRTFSKIYGLAGERIGWATGAPHLIDALNRTRGPFNVTASGQAAAIAGIKDQAFVEASRAHNASERSRFAGKIEALGNHGLRIIPSQANFVLVLFEGALSAAQALDGLAKAGYAVRHLPSQGLGHALRITIGTRADMDAIALALSMMAQDRASQG